MRQDMLLASELTKQKKAIESSILFKNSKTEDLNLRRQKKL